MDPYQLSPEHAYKTHHNSFIKKPSNSINIEENKSSIAKLGDLRMREKPYERVKQFEKRKSSYNGRASKDDSTSYYRVSRIRDICKFLNIYISLALALETKTAYQNSNVFPSSKSKPSSLPKREEKF